MNIEVVCDNCGKTFICKHKSRLNHKNLFCCKKCEGEYRKRQNLNMTCPICGKKFHAKPSYIAKAKHELCCSRECMGKYRKKKYKGESNPNFGNRGKDNPLYTGDTRISSYGYVLVKNCDHPFANGDGHVFEHRLVAEKYLLEPQYTTTINGKNYLSKDYVVHHINGIRTDNRPENLQIMSKEAHTQYHMQLRKLASQNLVKSVKPKS